MYRLRLPPAGVIRARPRRGRISTLVILALPVLLLIMALAINARLLVEAKTRLQGGGDAAALAGARGLIDDRFLGAGGGDLRPVLAAAHASARQIGAANHCAGQPLDLHDDDVEFGTQDTARSAFVPVGDWEHASPALLKGVNAVRVRAARCRARNNPIPLVGSRMVCLSAVDLIIRATAWLDRDIVGFRLVGHQVLALAPIALWSDPQGKDEMSWEHQVGEVLTATTHQGGTSPMTVKLRLSGAGGDDQGKSANDRTNACLLQIGVADLDGLVMQLQNGVTADDVRRLGRELILPPTTNSLILPGTTQGPNSAGGAAQRLKSALDLLQWSGKSLVWPLYSAIDAESGMPVVTGFVGARVVGVSEPTSRELTFILQPTMLATPTAVTDHARRQAVGPRIVNPYLCKVRLVD
jgi:hypothetical protein